MSQNICLEIKKRKVFLCLEIKKLSKNNFYLI